MTIESIAVGRYAGEVSVSTDEIKDRIEAGIPGAQADVTGDGHHFNAVVTSAAFGGMSRIARHRLVQNVFAGELGDRIHALSIQTKEPS